MFKRLILVAWLAALLTGATFLPGCAAPLGGVSDVPCITVPEWNDLLYFRLTTNGLLLTNINSEQAAEDNADGQIDYDVHSVVYRFDADTQEFTQVADEEWDDSEASVESCCGATLSFGRFDRDGTVLRFDGEPVAVAGGTFARIFPSPGNLMAAMSTTGRVGNRNVTSGQHYHQIFDAFTGERVGPALRIGVSGSIDGNWTENARFVIYFADQDFGIENGRRLCVVDRERHEE